MLFPNKTYVRKGRRKFTSMDLFSGCGGMSLGFMMAGGSPISALDNDSDSIDTFRLNFPIAHDVHACDIQNWRPRLKSGDVSVVIGGPPCQGFSLARGRRYVDDPRNSLYRYFVESLKAIKPAWFVMENVEGIKNIGDGVIFQQIMEDFTDAGYDVGFKVINMACYGVPQKRRRAIFVGNRLGEVFHWPEERYSDRSKLDQLHFLGRSMKPFFSVNDAISDLGHPLGSYFSHRANSKMRGPRNRDAFIDPAFTLRVRGDEFALCEKPAESAFAPGTMPTPLNYRFRPSNQLQEFLAESGPRYVKRELLPVCEGSAEELRGTRRLSLREQARLQSFPDWFNFVGSVSSQARQIGNAVPPIFCYQLFDRIMSYMD